MAVVEGHGCSGHVKAFFHPYLLPLKAVYFFQLGAAACLIPYIPLFIQHLGLNAAENGILFGALPFIAMVSKPSAGALSDRFKAPFLCLRVFTVVQLVFMFAVYFVPPRDPPTKPTTFCGLNMFPCSVFLEGFNATECPGLDNNAFRDNNYTCRVEGGNVSAPDIVSGDVPTISANIGQLINANSTCWCLPASESSVNPSPLVQWTHQFWLTGLLLAVGWFGYGAAVTLNDAIAFSVVESSPVKTTYGRNRVLDLFRLRRSRGPGLYAGVCDVRGGRVLAFGATFFLRAPKPVEIPPPLVKAVGRSLWTVDVMLFRYVAKVPWDGMVAWNGMSLGTKRRQERNVVGTKCHLGRERHLGRNVARNGTSPGRNVAWDGTSPGTERRLDGTPSQ
ncbi:hypothetical protein BV898_13544 [Hypsibius exemplaris]|uniref:Major facilitator superfamily associated domain-containing protein n=1 Tax=Hypsibius exemplaris TaxID=2072580 RepID=A0A1W0WAK6_HYPEX|nr:hypothetical protein BV898_13544 [Hypsibius exemplaris]